MNGNKSTNIDVGGGQRNCFSRAFKKNFEAIDWRLRFVLKLEDNMPICLESYLQQNDISYVNGDEYFEYVLRASREQIEGFKKFLNEKVEFELY